MRRLFRLDQNLDPRSTPETQLLAVDPENTGVAAPKHLQPATRTEAQLSQSVDFSGRAFQRFDPDRLAFRTTLQGDERAHTKAWLVGFRIPGGNRGNWASAAPQVLDGILYRPQSVGGGKPEVALPLGFLAPKEGGPKGELL